MLSSITLSCDGERSLVAKLVTSHCQEKLLALNILYPYRKPTQLILLLSVCLLLFVGLHKDPKQIASALINKPVPEFYQANLLEPSQIVSPRDFPKKPFLLNVWGSWCGYCQQEHPLLMEISKDVPIVGIDYRDKPQNGIAMLERMGNPFILTIDDSRGEFAMQLGVDGAPETYIIDEHGMIRYRHSGYMDRETWLTEIKPKLDELTKK